MIKKSIIFVMINVLLLCTACSKQNNNVVQPNEILSASERPKETLRSSENSEVSYHKVWDFIKMNEQEIKRKNKTYKSNSKNIRYPYFLEKKAKSINGLIKNSLYDMINKRFGSKWQEEKNLDLEIDYEIMYQGTEFISIYFEGNSYTAGAAHPDNVNFCLNIDVEKGILYKLSDFCQINKKFVEVLESNLQKQYPEDYWGVLDFMCGEDLENYLEKSDQNNKTVLFRSFFRKNKLIVVCKTPHAIGGYIFIELNPEDIDRK